MLKFKVKHKLLVIWLGSIILTLSVLAGLFQYQVAGLHQEEARAAIARAINTLHQDLELAANGIQLSTHSLSGRSDLIASMNMIDRYQDTDNYLEGVFDVEKSKLAKELSQHATATGADVIALYDSQGVLAAFHLSRSADGQGAGIISYANGNPLVLRPDTADVYQGNIQSLVSQLSETKTTTPGHVVITHDYAERLLLSSMSPIKRERSNGIVDTVGTIYVGRVLGDDFDLTMSRATGMDFRILHPGHAVHGADISEDDAHVIETGVPDLILDGNPDHNTTYKWVSSTNHFLGIVHMQERTGNGLFFIFSQQKDALQSTLKAFQGTVLAVMLITGLFIVPIGIFFLNRTITRPVENLVQCADDLRRGQHHDMEGFSGSDEFSELAQSFEIMSTAVRAREDALKDSQKSLKNAQRIAHIGNWEWDLHTGYVRYSDQIYSILARSRDHMGNKFEPLLHCVHEDDRRTLKHRIAEAIESGQEFKMEHRIIRPDGTERYVIHHGEMYHAGEDVVRISATLQDITERHQLELTKSELISTVSHELRTPLTSIIGTLGLAAGGALGELPETVMTMLKSADSNAKRLGLLIDDLLDIEKIASGSMSFDFHPLNIRDAVNQAVETNQSYAEGLGVNIHIENGVADVQVMADQARIAQVLANLLSNAAKFSPNGSTVRVNCKREDKYVAVSVHDEGPGIPEDFRPHIFERFTQADQSLTRQDQKGGTGLGLAITKAIIEMHDGNIDFNTVCEPDPAHGTTFTFRLPEWDEQQDHLPLNP